MPSAPRYDVVVVGGGLSGIAAATWLAKRGRRVLLVEPRAEWGGCFPDQRLGGVTVSFGPRIVTGHERLGWADAYFEAIGLSRALLVREGATFAREAIQLIWGPRRLTLGQQRADFAEELRREYRVNEPEVAALLADLDAIYDALAIRMDPAPAADTRASLARLRALAGARAFAARFGALAPAAYVRARGLADAFAAYFESWRGALAVEGDPAGAWLFRTSMAHRGLVSLPAGRAAVCRLLVARFQALGGEVIRTPVLAVGAGREPFLETDGRRISAQALIINARCRPGTQTRDQPHGAVSTASYTVPTHCVPEAMGAYLLVTDGTDTWSLARRRHEGTGGAATDRLEVSYRGQPTGRDADLMRERVAALLPFAAEQVKSSGAARHDETPDPVDPKLWEAVSWRVRRADWVQAARAPVWWLPDECAPWLGDAREYRAALTLTPVVHPS